MEIGACLSWRAFRPAIQSSSVQWKFSAGATIEAVAGAASASLATGSAFKGSLSPCGPRTAYL